MARSSVNHQVNSVFIKSGIFTPGTSKHEAKEFARGNGCKTWQEIGTQLNIYSYSTAAAYKDVWHQIGHFAKRELSIKNIEKINGYTIQHYLETRIADGIKYSTFQKEAAAAMKFERALNLYADRVGSSRIYNFHTQTAAVRKDAAQILERFTETRQYKNPEELISHISKSESKLAAAIQHQSGARVAEVALLNKNQLAGIRERPATKEQSGVIKLYPGDAKGGKPRSLYVKIETYKELENQIERNGRFKINPSSYRNDLKQAAERSGQKYTGSHGLRWNFAQERFSKLEGSGYSYSQSLAETSWEMGHERPDITEHYLG